MIILFEYFGRDLSQRYANNNRKIKDKGYEFNKNS